jgi:hypothetical protein
MRIFWLRSAVGEREEWSAAGETAGTESERNAAAEPQTEARRYCGNLPMPARDERGFCEAEQARSQGSRGDRQACEEKQKSRWSRRVKFIFAACIVSC